MDSKDTFFSTNMTINCRGNLLSFDEVQLMYILNITPDSFYDGGKQNNLETILKNVEKALSEGASIIDLGGSSSRPGASLNSWQDEWKRIEKPLKEIHHSFPTAIISIDTYHQPVAEKALQIGADIINDISAGKMDTNMIPFIGKNNIPYIAMHMQGTPQNMQANPQYENVTKSVLDYFNELKEKLKNDYAHTNLIIDPGFGFGKSLEHNYQLLNELEVLHTTGLPILAGVSRKSMIYKPLGVTPQEALNGTTFIHTHLLQKNVQLLRVHDVKEAKELITLNNIIHQ